LVLGWSGALVRAAAGLPGEELVVPSSPADAARLAAALGSLIDQVGTEADAWAGLFSGLPADLARYWEITLEFLKIATQAWPLAEGSQQVELGAGHRHVRALRIAQLPQPEIDPPARKHQRCRPLGSAGGGGYGLSAQHRVDPGQ